MAWAVLVEVYRDYDVKFEEAMVDLNTKMADPAAPPKRKPPSAADEAASLAMLQSMMAGSDFRGPKG